MRNNLFFLTIVLLASYSNSYSCGPNFWQEAATDPEFVKRRAQEFEAEIRRQKNLKNAHKLDAQSKHQKMAALAAAAKLVKRADSPPA